MKRNPPSRPYKTSMHQPVRHLKGSTSNGATMKLCLVLALFLVGAASADIEKRILGSKSCGSDRQYHVQIETVQGGRSCGGALLNTRWVITASHCAEQDVNVKFGLNYDAPTKKKIKDFFKGKFKKPEQKIPKAQQFTYKDEEGNAHDIMLIKLSEDVSSKLPVIELPSGECKRPELKDKVEVGGMGEKKKGKQTGKKLSCATTIISECGENDKPDSRYHSGDSTMCANKPGVESCYGDAGSAVEQDGHLHGIIVSDPADKCMNPIVMLDICSYVEWIDTTMKENP